MAVAKLSISPLVTVFMILTLNSSANQLNNPPLNPGKSAFKLRIFLSKTNSKGTIFRFGFLLSANHTYKGAHMKIIPIQPQADTQPVSTDGVCAPPSTGHTDHSRRTFGGRLPIRRTFGEASPDWPKAPSPSSTPHTPTLVNSARCSSCYPTPGSSSYPAELASSGFVGPRSMPARGAG